MEVVFFCFNNFDLDKINQFDWFNEFLFCFRLDSVSPPFHISLNDLLNAEQKGKWWLLGSAWTRADADLNQSQSSSKNAFHTDRLIIYILLLLSCSSFGVICLNLH